MAVGCLLLSNLHIKDRLDDVLAFVNFHIFSFYQMALAQGLNCSWLDWLHVYPTFPGFPYLSVCNRIILGFSTQI